MTMTARFRALALTTLAAFALAACSDDEDGPTTPPTPTNGSLAVTISGLPTGTTGTVTVTGPSNFTQTLTATQTLSVAPGSYSVSAAQVTSGTTRYNATITGSPATVTSNATANVTVAYAVAQNPTVVLSGSISANRTLTPDTNYVLRGFVYVNSGATLTINAGTRIVGDTTALGSALFVLRGARSQANGTAEGSNGSVVGADPNGIVYTGGTVDNDNSGTLRYVRVEFAGYATLTDAELNSYTFAAVGSGTTVEYVQALAGLDDNFEWFGGTVNGKYLVSYESGDDHFDGSEGYRGLNQFMIGLQSTYLTPRPGAGAVSSDPQGFEIDGCNGGGCVAPSGANAQSAGRDEGLWNMNVFANFTLIGPASGVTVPGSGGVGAVLRRGTGGYYLNGVIARWGRGGISLRDSTTNNRFQVDSLIVRNLYFAENGGLVNGSNFDAAGSNFGQETAFTARNSNIVVGASTVTASSLFTALPATPTNGASLDWSPAANSPIGTGGLASFSNDPRIAARVGTFITPTAYRGAAAPGGTKWWEGWTNYARN